MKKEIAQREKQERTRQQKNIAGASSPPLFIVRTFIPDIYNQDEGAQKEYLATFNR